MNAAAIVSIYVVTNRAPYLKCDAPVSVYVAVVWTPDHPKGPGLLEGLCQTMLLVTSCGSGRRLGNSQAASLAQQLKMDCWYAPAPGVLLSFRFDARA